MRETAIRGFLAAHGWEGARRLPMGADWSNRRYERLQRDGASAILMDAAADSPVGAFVAVDRWLRGIGLHAPELYGIDEAAGLLLLEDMGDDLLARVVEAGGDEVLLYGLALEVILRCQRAQPPSFLLIMDDAVLLGLLDVYLEHVLQAGEEEAAAFRALWAEVLPLAHAGGEVFLYRDYHAENLLWLPHERGLWRMGLLDFQDAFVGPAGYDVVSLIQDARRDVAPAVQEAVVAAYLAARPEIDREAFAAAMAVLGAQRATRILGVIGRLAATRGRVFPLGMRRRVRSHLRASLQHPALARLRAWCERHGALSDESSPSST